MIVGADHYHPGQQVRALQRDEQAQDQSDARRNQGHDDSGLRAEGAFLVGAERRAGMLVRLHVRSLAGESTRVRAEGLNQLLSAAGEVPGIRLIGNNEAILELAAGEEVLLIADAVPQALAPVAADNPAEVGFFGLKTN